MRCFICTLHLIVLFITLANAQSQWQIIPSTAGKYFVDITIYHSDPDTMYAGGLDAGLWLSTDH